MVFLCWAGVAINFITLLKSKNFIDNNENEIPFQFYFYSKYLTKYGVVVRDKLILFFMLFLIFFSMILIFTKLLFFYR